MNTEKPLSEHSTTSENNEKVQEVTKGRSTSEGPRESITDHHTKCLRPELIDGGRDRAAAVLHYRGPFRVYFNRKEEAPRIVSIDNGSHAWEIVCKSVTIAALSLKSTFDPTKEYPNPAFTLEGVGMVRVDMNGNATID